MSEKMLKFVEISKETPTKIKSSEKMILMRFIKNLLEAMNNQVDVHSVEFHFVKFTVHFTTIFLIG